MDYNNKMAGGGRMMKPNMMGHGGKMNKMYEHGGNMGGEEMSKEEKMAMMLESMAPEDIMMLREMIDAKMESEMEPQGPPRPAGPMVRPQPMMRRGVSRMG
jgi:hypothetical protein|tara:strand:+ start:744 stop:1046 length:303 start_codon:yes stop_codon:yes gene_type:complete